ncbi:MAG: hypothetical protein IPM45_04330 [Acidimicrobiales bacterium]|nr:hypothetical protein [Acidimicrobiales bacterium]
MITFSGPDGETVTAVYEGSITEDGQVVLTMVLPAGAALGDWVVTGVQLTLLDGTSSQVTDPVALASLRGFEVVAPPSPDDGLHLPPPPGVEPVEVPSPGDVPEVGFESDESTSCEQVPAAGVKPEAVPRTNGNGNGCEWELPSDIVVTPPPAPGDISFTIVVSQSPRTTG